MCTCGMGLHLPLKEFGDLACQAARRMLSPGDEGKRAEDVVTRREEPSPCLEDPSAHR